MRIINRQNGETIIEVLISIAVLGLVLAASYTLANRSGQANRQSQERAEALGENVGRVEFFKSYLEGNNEVPSGTFCVFKDSDGELKAINIVGGIPPNAQGDNLTNYPNQCKAGLSGRYNSAVRKSGDTYIFSTRWLRASDDGIEELSLRYNIDSLASLSLNPDSDISIIPLPECRDGDDNDFDGNTDFPSDLGCENGDDTTESPDPIPVPVPEPEPEPDPGPCYYKVFC